MVTHGSCIVLQVALSGLVCIVMCISMNGSRSKSFGTISSITKPTSSSTSIQSTAKPEKKRRPLIDFRYANAENTIVYVILRYAVQNGASGWFSLAHTLSMPPSPPSPPSSVPLPLTAPEPVLVEDSHQTLVNSSTDSVSCISDKTLVKYSLTNLVLRKRLEQPVLQQRKKYFNMHSQYHGLYSALTD